MREKKRRLKKSNPTNKKIFFLLMLFTPEGRRAFRTPGPYWAALVCALISLPNLIWLAQNDMVALRYAFGRASLGDGAREVELSYSRLLEQPLRCLNRAVSVLIVPLVPFLLIFFRRDPAMASDLFDRRFVAFLGLGPFAFTLLFSLLSGGSINYSWVVPCFPLSGLFLVLWFKPYINRFSLKWFTGFLIFLWVVFAVIFAGRSLWQQPYRKRGCDYENFPGKALAEHVTREWRTRYGTPLPFVIGPRRESCNVAVYSADRPQAYFSANPEFSQWIDEEEIREKGAVILFDGRPKRRPRWLGRLTESGFSLTPEVRIEEECLKILALHQPVAGDLRYIITLLKVNNELDRIGDLAQNIAERAIDLAEHPVPAAGIELGPMMTEVRIMLKQALDALSCRDTGRAAEVIARDDTVDRLHRENFRLIKQGLIRQPEAADYYLNMLTASRHLERVADCATNIGEDVIYLEQGRIVRHAHLS